MTLDPRIERGALRNQVSLLHRAIKSLHSGAVTDWMHGGMARWRYGGGSQGAKQGLGPIDVDGSSPRLANAGSSGRNHRSLGRGAVSCNLIVLDDCLSSGTRTSTRCEGGGGDGRGRGVGISGLGHMKCGERNVCA